MEKLEQDAPIINLLRLQHNKLIVDMTMEELVAHLEHVRSLVQSPTKLSSVLSSEAKVTKNRISPKTIAIQNKLNEL